MQKAKGKRIKARGTGRDGRRRAEETEQQKRAKASTQPTAQDTAGQANLCEQETTHVHVEQEPGRNQAQGKQTGKRKATLSIDERQPRTRIRR